ncbi:NAD(P)/FAD-dependent oxidoreductase [Romboutsia sp. 1001713B170207_170306_H8]|uniref:NAD(P)/FAD-dependent oxidoreductase n=1 Tax=Romboutsia sp. 1001713B170207_170306_H8 TaxID=2787112 RepID=UPI0008205B89|nr:FAD-dependent oxidoreductase [Romboutsia sp. 1001713B170207_170306_H8]SCI26906.1 soluble pyridine nucleotide transhydrogenase [uncultured Clostridium sp.]
MREYDLVIIGGGAAGILCAIEGKKRSIESILIIEKDPDLGGMLSNSDYNIGNEIYITGKEYKEKILKELERYNVDINLNTMVLNIEENNEVVCTSSQRGIEKIKGKNVIIANGGKEKSRNSITAVGDRVSGILTIGMAKKIFAMEDMVPGKNILIVGDATIYMIEQELKKYNINVVGILCEDGNADRVKSLGLKYNIYEGYKLVGIYGDGRVSKVSIERDNHIKEIFCDTLIFSYPMLSDGVVAMRSNIVLNPETTGSKVDENYKTSRDNIYACGNGIYIHNDIYEIEKECKELIENLK